MDSLNERHPIGQMRPRSLKPFILERGCPEFEELVALRAEGWNDALLNSVLDDHFTKTRKNADESTSEKDVYWLPLMESCLKQIDSGTQCIPQGTLRRFLDLGCCPGGFSNYVLTKNPRSQGVGVSLAVNDGGHGIALPSTVRSRFEVHWGDLTYFDTCSPRSHPPPVNKPALMQTIFLSGDFQLVMVDGQHRRSRESETTHKWDINRLLIAQLIIAVESLDIGGTLIIRFGHLESSITARLVYMLDKSSKKIYTYKPHLHDNRGSFYVVSFGFGLGVYGWKRTEFLEGLRNVWWTLTYGGPDGEGRWLEEKDLDFIVDFETLTISYLDRLIRLGRGPWRVQKNALIRTFNRVRKRCSAR